MQVMTEQGESDAHAVLNQATHGELTRELMGDQIALIDYLLKQQTRRLRHPPGDLEVQLTLRTRDTILSAIAPLKAPYRVPSGTPSANCEEKCHGFSG
jgi:hypothetical protein